MSVKEFLQDVSEAHSAQPTLAVPAKAPAVAAAAPVALVVPAQYQPVRAEEVYTAICANFAASAERTKLAIFNTSSKVWGGIKAANAAIEREAAEIVNDFVNPPQFMAMRLIPIEDGASIPLDQQHCTPYIWDHEHHKHWNWGVANTMTGPG